MNQALEMARNRLSEKRDPLEPQREERFRVLDEIGNALRDVPYDEIEQEVAMALAEVRATAQ